MILEYQEVSRLLEQFAAELPALLGSHPKTANLVPQVAHLHEIAEARFTLAVVGQMRVGKSSLLNALMKKDRAIVGVTETTATINFFKYGQGDQTDRFRVTWKDRPEEELDLTEIRRWTGDSTAAAQTQFLEFFVDSEYLLKGNIVDTPGTRSAIESHTETVNEFLAAKQDGQTRKLGGEADAILYVVPSVARQSDEDMLRDFQSTTRPPGSSPYNSLAVLHKWETLEAPDAFAEAGHKAERIRKVMDGLISVVIPVSAPLGKAAEQYADGFWQTVLNLAVHTPAPVLQEMLMGEEEFLDETPGCALSTSDRRQLRSQYPLPWPSLKVIIEAGQREKPADPAAFRARVLDMSGLVRLRQELQSRFFDRSHMIKSFSVLSKAWDACRTADVRLRNHKVGLTDKLQRAPQLKSVLAERIRRGETDLQPVQDYLQATLGLLEKEVEDTSVTLRCLDAKLLEVEEVQKDMDGDRKCLERLTQGGDGLPPELADLLANLFGRHGASMTERLSFLARKGRTVARVRDLDEAIERLKQFSWHAGRQWSDLAEHGVKRLEAMANWMETHSHDEIQLTH